MHRLWFDWTPKDIEATAIAIAKICNFNFIPSLIPFSDDRATFFCNSTDEVTLVANKGIIKTPSTTVLLNKYHKMLNAIDTNYSRFRGWIAIKGLPFLLWNSHSFENIASQCGELLEIHTRTANFSILTEAKIKVKATGTSSIPETISFKSDDNWLTIQLILLFTIEEPILMQPNGIKRRLETNPPTKHIRAQKEPDLRGRVPNLNCFRPTQYRMKKKLKWVPSSMPQGQNRHKTKGNQHWQTNTMLSSPVPAPTPRQFLLQPLHWKEEFKPLQLVRGTTVRGNVYHQKGWLRFNPSPVSRLLQTSSVPTRSSWYTTGQSKAHYNAVQRQQPRGFLPNHWRILQSVHSIPGSGIRMVPSVVPYFFSLCFCF